MDADTIKWYAERYDQWSRHVQAQTQSLNTYVDMMQGYGTEGGLPDFPFFVRHVGIKPMRRILAEIATALDQMELAAECKDGTHYLESKAVYLEPEPDFVVDDHEGSTPD